MRPLRTGLSLLLASALLAAGWSWRVSRPSGAKVIKLAYVGSVDDPRHLSVLTDDERPLVLYGEKGREAHQQSSQADD